MFKNEDLRLLDLSLKKIFFSKFAERTNSLRRFLLDSPTQQPDIFLQFDLTHIQLKVTKLSEKIGLACMSWYMPDEIKILLQMDLKENWGADGLEIRDILLNSKDFMLSWLIIQNRWSESDFFGNVLTKRLSYLWTTSNFKRMSQRKVERYSGYCRGYQESHRPRIKLLPAELRLDHLSLEEIEAKKLVQLTEFLHLKEQILDLLSRQAS